jgi:hypothetical protein
VTTRLQSSEKDHGVTAQGGALALAQALNRGCDCRSLDPERLRQQLEAEPSLLGLAAEIQRSRPHMFSATAVFMAPQTLQAMANVVAAVESVVALPAYKAEALARAPAIAQLDHGPKGVFMGFDFHVCDRGPQLIEINTNAGGAMLNRALAHAQQACCAQILPHLRPTADLDALDCHWLDSFVAEWTLQGREGRPRRIAIVDEAPGQQYLHPEFLLFSHLFRSAGIDTVICDPSELAFSKGLLTHADGPVDLVYNRLTDFYLQSPGAEALRAAYEAGAIVLTPHPRAHALYADKRNLALLSDPVRLAALGVPRLTIDNLLTGIPRTVEVTPERAEALWAGRRGLFFKPAAGFGSRAAYRGDKLTLRVWQSILGGGYVAQSIALPSERRVRVDGAGNDLKLDIRVYAYGGEIQLVAARLYMGQTTNFRTPGGGFAPVFLTSGEQSPTAVMEPGLPGSG